jgi:hypothetical protein
MRESREQVKRQDNVPKWSEHFHSALNPWSICQCSDEYGLSDFELWTKGKEIFAGERVLHFLQNVLI